MTRTQEPDFGASSGYEDDFHGWTCTQAALIRAGRIGEIDLANIAEEIENLGRKERADLESAYRLICLHQLEFLVQRERATRSWGLTLVRERLHAERVLRDNPSLKPKRCFRRIRPSRSIRSATRPTGREPDRPLGLAMR